MLQAWVFCPGITLYAWATGTLDPHLSALWGSLAGLFSLVAFTNFARSLQDGAVSTNAPIFRLNFTLTAALAILLLGETLTLAKAGALVCALIAVWLLLAAPGLPAALQRPRLRSLTRVLIATAAMALANFFYKVGLQQGALPETVVAAQAWVFSSTATLIVCLRDRRLRLTPRAWRYSAPAAIALVVAFVLLMHGLARGPASVLEENAPLPAPDFSALLEAVGDQLAAPGLSWPGALWVQRSAPGAATAPTTAAVPTRRPGAM
jgi:uncharacterized membrane protein